MCFVCSLVPFVWSMARVLGTTDLGDNKSYHLLKTVNVGGTIHLIKGFTFSFLVGKHSPYFTPTLRCVNKFHHMSGDIGHERQMH